MEPMAHVTPNGRACMRTKNRVREHGPIFTILNEKESVPCLDGEAGFLFRSDDGWEGWIPKAEIEGPIIGD